MFDLPGYIWMLTLTGAVGIPATTVSVMYHGARAAEMRRSVRGGVAGSLAALWGGWILISALLADEGVYRQARAGFRGCS